MNPCAFLCIIGWTRAGESDSSGDFGGKNRRPGRVAGEMNSARQGGEEGFGTNFETKPISKAGAPTEGRVWIDMSSPSKQLLGFGGWNASELDKSYVDRHVLPDSRLLWGFPDAGPIISICLSRMG